MRFFFQILAFLFMHFSLAQVASDYSVIDAKMAQIPKEQTNTTTAIAEYINANFKTESEKIRATFFWTAVNISYDVANMYEPNFIYTPQEKIANALKTKKGVCIHYAEVFTDIANQLGIKATIITGYTKQNGKVAPISHAWCGAKVDGKWLLFDPTWASGYVDQTNKFVKKFNNSFYTIPPSKHITSHMPFDYMWQFLSSPITNNEFVSGKTLQEKRIVNYDFATEIANYEKLSQEQKAFETAQRVEKNGVINDLVSGYLANKKNEFNVLRQNKSIDQLNQIVADYNEAIIAFNDFVYYRNAKFKPKVSDEELLKKIQNPIEKLKNCQDDVNKIGFVGKENTSMVNSLRKSITETLKQAGEHEVFVKEYLSKSEGKRKSMFTKVTWMGIPVR